MSQTNNPKTDAGAAVGSDIVRASFAVGAAHVIFKFLGLILAIAVGRAIANDDFDVIYVFAFEGVILSLFLIGEEVIGPCFLPVFTEQLRKRGEAAAWRFANTLLTVQFLVLAVVVALVATYPDAVINLVTDWDESDGARRQQARDAVRLLAPALIGLSLGSTTYVILNGYKRFFTAAFGDAASKFVILVSVVVGIMMMELDYEVLLWGILAGSVAKLAPHAIGLGKQLRFLRPAFAVRDPAFRKFWILALPLIAGIVIAKYRDLYSNVTVLSGLTEAGLMKANSFGRKLFLAISWLVPYAVSIAMFPYLCELVEQRDHRRLGEVVTKAGRMILSVFIPATAVLAALSPPLAQLLFRGGEFGADTVALAAISNACYVCVLPAFSLEYILMQGFFANRRMTSVIVIGIVFSFVTIGLTMLTVRGLNADGATALVLVALAWVVARSGKVLTLALLMRRFAPIFPLKETASFVARSVLSAIVAGGAAWLTVSLMMNNAQNTDKFRLLLICIGATVASGVAGLPVAHLLRVDEPLTMFKWTLAKVRSRIRRQPSSET